MARARHHDEPRRSARHSALLAVGVVAAALAAGPANRPRQIPTTRQRAARGYGFVQRPLAVVTREGANLPSFSVYFRVTRPMPTGRRRGYATLEGLRAPGGIPGFVPESRACAEATLNATRSAAGAPRGAPPRDPPPLRAGPPRGARAPGGPGRLVRPPPPERG